MANDQFPFPFGWYSFKLLMSALLPKLSSRIDVSKRE